MRTTRSINRSVLIVLLAAAAATAQDHASQPDPAPPDPRAPASTPAAGQDAANLLGGPAVPEHVKGSLVHRRMTGEFIRVEGRPEAAALEKLRLDPATLEAALAVVSRRQAALAALLVERIDDVREATDAIRAGDAARARELARGLHAAFEPDRPRDALLPALAEVLTPEQTAEMRRLLDEYWSAWIAWEARGGAGLPRDRVQARLIFQLFQEEVRRAYDVSLRHYRDVLEGVYAAIDPTEAQRESVRTIVIDHISETRLDATPEQRRATMRRIYDALDDERRALLFDYVVRALIND